MNLIYYYVLKFLESISFSFLENGLCKVVLCENERLIEYKARFD